MREIFSLVGRIGIEGIDTLEKGLNNLDKNLNKAVKRVDKFGRDITKLGTSLTKLTAPIAAMGVVAFKGVQAASDLAETVSKAGFIFGDSAKDIEAWAGTAAASLGQSKQQAIDAASNFAIFGKSAGLTGDRLVKFSTNFAGLASDLASFNNTSPEEAITAIGAALRGESEPIRKYGVLLDDASIRAKALEMGLVSTTKNALTPQQKVLAVSALIMKQTAAAQGDFARTSGGLANQTRIFKAEVANLTAEYGKAFLPVALDVMKILREKLLPTVQKLVNGWNALSDGTKTSAIRIAALSVAAGPLLIAFGKSITLIKEARAAFILLNATLLANPFIAAATGATLLGVALYTAAQNGKKLKDSMEEVGSKQTARLKTDIEELIGLYNELSLGSHSVIDEDRLAEASKRIKDLEKNVGDLGVEFTGNFADRAMQAENYLTDLEFQTKKDTAATNDFEKALGELDAAAALSAEELKRLAEERKKFADEWMVKRKQITSTELEAIYVEMDEALKAADKIGASEKAKNDVRAYYTEKMRQYAVDQQKATIEEVKSRADAADTKRKAELDYLTEQLTSAHAATATKLQQLDLQIEAEKSVAEQSLRFADEIAAAKLAIDQKYAAQRLELLKNDAREREGIERTIVKAQEVMDDERSQMGTEFVHMTFGLFSQATDNKLALLEMETERNKAAIESSVMSEEDKKSRIAAIEARADKKKRELMLKQAKRDKAAAIFNAILGGAQLVMNGLNTQPFFPLGIIMGALAGVLAAAQIAVIAARPLPQLAKGGLAKSTPGGMDVTVAEGGQDELILPMRTGIRDIVRGIIDGIAGAVLPPAASPALAFGGGGSAAPASGYRGGDVHYHIGTMIADESGYKMLERKMRPIRTAEDQRRGL